MWENSKNQILMEVRRIFRILFSLKYKKNRLNLSQKIIGTRLDRDKVINLYLQIMGNNHSLKNRINLFLFTKHTINQQSKNTERKRHNETIKHTESKASWFCVCCIFSLQRERGRGVCKCDTYSVSGCVNLGYCWPQMRFCFGGLFDYVFVCLQFLCLCEKRQWKHMTTKPN